MGYCKHWNKLLRMLWDKEMLRNNALGNGCQHFMLVAIFSSKNANHPLFLRKILQIASDAFVPCLYLQCIKNQTCANNHLQTTTNVCNTTHCIIIFLKFRQHTWKKLTAHWFRNTVLDKIKWWHRHKLVYIGVLM